MRSHASELQLCVRLQMGSSAAPTPTSTATKKFNGNFSCGVRESWSSWKATDNSMPSRVCSSNCFTQKDVLVVLSRSGIVVLLLLSLFLYCWGVFFNKQKQKLIPYVILSIFAQVSTVVRTLPESTGSRYPCLLRLQGALKFISNLFKLVSTRHAFILMPS